LGGGKVRSVLALLAVHVNEAVSEDALVEALWGNGAPRTSSKTLQSYVSRLRGALAEGQDRLTVETTPGGYRLRAAEEALDVAKVEALAAQARDAAERGDHSWAAVALSEALRTWRGVPLAEFATEPWATAESARLAELRETLIEERVDAELACGRHAALVPELEALTSEHPLRERLWGQRMVALYRAGRQADALRVYQALRKRLADELGIDPSPGLRRLEQQVLDQDRALEWTPLEPEVARPSASRRPTGVVTVLLTDVEGSTARWDEDPEAMAAALAQHDVIVREAVEAHGGTLVKSKGEGDSTFSVFATAEAAANAATAIHQGLQASGSLRTRIGIHTGEPDERDDDYFGPTLNRAARLRDAACGGQTICSSVTGHLLLDGVRPVEVVDLGEHHLRDLGRVEHVFQIGGGTFPPLRSLERQRHNLPARATSFIGRGNDVGAVVELLEDYRLVVLTGVGGVGKTRLGLEVATAFVDRGLDGVFFVDLAPVSDPSLITSAIGKVLPGGAGSAIAEDELLAYLARRQVLVVLDNCEHLVDACADLLEKVLSAGGPSRVLATSREAFGLAGERDWQVRSLREDECRELFATRASAVRTSFRVDETNAATVDEICRRLDGIPLAIELAAARVAHLPPQQIAERLNDRFTLLTGGRGRVQRQHTLQTALDWSHDLLESEEQVLLRRLGVFNGSFTLPAAEGICSDDQLLSARVLDLLSSLVNRSLVDAQDDGRYRLLETVRLYAEVRLADAAETEDVRDRHLRWFVGWAESLAAVADSVDEQAERLERDFDNVSAAVAWALAQRRAPVAGRLIVAAAPMWMWARHAWEVDPWLSSVLNDPESLEPDLLVACLACRSHNGSVLLAEGAWDLAAAGTRVVGAAKTGLLATCWAQVAQSTATFARLSGDLQPAELDQAVAEALAIHHSLAAPDVWAAEALNLCGEAYLMLGRYPECIRLAEQSEAVATAIGVAWLAAMNRRMLAVAWHLLGEHERAMAVADLVLEDSAHGIGPHEAIVLAADGQIVRARERTLQNLAWATEFGRIPLHEVEAVIILGCIEAAVGNHGRAATILAAGRSLGRQVPIGFRTPMSWALYAHYLPMARAALGPDAARHARDRGRAMSFEDVISYACDEEVT
jgi:predicted ATPase/DNA-binding SARP family transcriptional activator